MSNLPDVEQIKEVVDLYALAARHTPLAHWARRESAGPCPRCGGKDRFHVYDDDGRPGAGQWWKCYRCHPRPGDAIEFVRWLEGCDFTTALNRLAEMAGSTLPPAGPGAAPAGGHRPRRQAGRGSAAGQAPPAPEDAIWQARAQREVAAAARRLWRPEGEPGRRYLAARGFFPLTWRAWSLGFAYAWHPRRGERWPAITIPWYMGSRIMAVQYRFFAPAPAGRGVHGRPAQELAHGDRFSQKPGGVRRIYGLPLLKAMQPPAAKTKTPAPEDGPDAGRPAVPAGDEAREASDARTLVMVEGELNAVSIWQAFHDPGPWAVPPAFHIGPADVVSFGSETGANAVELAELAARYDRALIWTDRPERAAEAAALLRGCGVRSQAVGSPQALDANDLLRADRLVEFLAAVLAQC